jgi:hypothetical protein
LGILSGCESQRNGAGDKASGQFGIEQPAGKRFTLLAIGCPETMAWAISPTDCYKADFEQIRQNFLWKRACRRSANWGFECKSPVRTNWPRPAALNYIFGQRGNDFPL